jgi:hypothetical protein
MKISCLLVRIYLDTAELMTELRTFAFHTGVSNFISYRRQIPAIGCCGLRRQLGSARNTAFLSCFLITGPQLPTTTATTTVTATITTTTTTTTTTIVTTDLFINIISNNVVRSEIFLSSMFVLHVKTVLLYAFQLLMLLRVMLTRLEPKLLL